MNNPIKFFSKFSYAILVATALIFTSCDKEDVQVTDVESLTDLSIQKMHFGAIGKNACLEFVFPISIQFVDESTVTADSYEELHTLISDWFESTDVEITRESKPQLIFPIQVLNEDAEVLDVASLEDLKALKSECPGGRKPKGKKGKGFKCFSLGFPVALTIDGVDTSFDDKESLKAAVKAYKESAGDDAVRPTLVFPVTVVYDDGNEAIANSKEELIALKKACKMDGE